jgi:predicted lipoprotein with Yx(FWY)xxD motif
MKTTKMVFGVGAALLLSVVAPATVAYASASPIGHEAGSGHKGGDDHGRPGSDRGAAVVSIESSPYGPVLVVGGAGAGYVAATSTTPAVYNFPVGSSLYFATIDPSAYDLDGHSYQAGCTTVVDGSVGFACTGSPVTDGSDWPALTTEGPPIAGRGVSQRLLGAVYRADLGAFQVTYAGHPLYLFDSGPNSFFGANFFESVLPLPPWHTAWYLMAPSGLAAPGIANLEPETPNAQTTYTSAVVGAEMLPNVAPGGAAITVYSFSSDSPWQSRCNWSCAMDFIPVLTSGPPTVAAGINAHGVGVIERSDSSHQVTYDGHPLYIYSQEQPAVDGSGNPVLTGSVGNGNGIHAFGGTFRVVSP